MGISNTLDKYPVSADGGCSRTPRWSYGKDMATYADNVPFYDTFRLAKKKTPGYSSNHLVWISESTGGSWPMLSPDVFYLLHHADIIDGKVTGWWRAINRGAYGLEYVLPENIGKGVHLPKEPLDDSSLAEYAKFNIV